jgi:transposase
LDGRRRGRSIRYCCGGSGAVSRERSPGDDLLQVKYEMLRQVDVDKQPVSQAAKEFGFSRPSFYQAQAAFQQAGLAGLLPHKRGPRSGHKLTGELMQFVTKLRSAEPELSAPQLAQRVAQRFGVSVHPRSIDRQLQRQKKLR